jgi:hypothetical protein
MQAIEQTCEEALILLIISFSIFRLKKLPSSAKGRNDAISSLIFREIL